MGRKVHPMVFRIGVTTDWQSRWYAGKSYAEFLREDLKLRKFISEKYVDAGIAGIEIERQANEVTVTIQTARPGIVIGRGGQRVDEMRTSLEQMIGKKIRLNIREIQQPELNAFLVAKSVADQLARRIAHRRTMKQAMFRTMQAGAKGIRISCSGRLGGNEIARRETMHEGRVPLQTIRADIDYGFTEARTNMGRIGVKVWLYKGDILPERDEMEFEEMPEPAVSEDMESVTIVDTDEEAQIVGAPEAEAPAKIRRKTTAKAVEVPEAEAATEAPAKTSRKTTAKAVEVPEVEVVDKIAEVAEAPEVEAATEAEVKTKKIPKKTEPTSEAGGEPEA